MREYPYIIAKQVADGSWWYEGADEDLDHAVRVVFRLGSQQVYKNARIVKCETQEELDALRGEINNLPEH